MNVYEISQLRGINQDTGLINGELADCENIVGESEGFSVWKGRARYTPVQLGAQSALFSAVWPDEHESLVVFGECGLKAIEGGTVSDIIGDLSFDDDPRNPCHLSMFSRGRYLVGSTYLRNPAFYWEGNIDRSAETIETGTMRYRVVEPWNGRLWGIDGTDMEHDVDFPLYAFYGDIDELEIKAGQWMEFRDNPLASRLIGMRSFGRSYAYVWGDRGLWQLQYTGKYPLFAYPTLLSADCDCVSNGGIVEIPGVGFAWRGLENYWLMVGDQVRKINLSNDTRRANRVKGRLDDASLNDLYLVRGYYYRSRGLVLWTYPTNKCLEQYPWQNPQMDAWDPLRDTWWPISYAPQGMAEVTNHGSRMMVGTNEDGYLYLLDRNIDYDVDDYLHWHCEFDWIGLDEVDSKWLSAILERPFQGTDKVEANFWCRQQSSAIDRSFSLSQTFDDASLENGFDPGGPHDAGLPPDPRAITKVPIRLVGKKLKVKLSNYDGSSYWNGPKKPMNKLKILAKTLSRTR